MEYRVVTIGVGSGECAGNKRPAARLSESVYLSLGKHAARGDHEHPYPSTQL